MGPAAVVAASIIAADFSLVDRAENAIGISVDAMVLQPSVDFREELGINRFPSVDNTLGEPKALLKEIFKSSLIFDLR
jgi:hypothetical protein